MWSCVHVGVYCVLMFQFAASGLMIIARNYLDVYPYDKWNAKVSQLRSLFRSNYRLCFSECMMMRIKSGCWATRFAY